MQQSGGAAGRMKVRACTARLPSAARAASHACQLSSHGTSARVPPRGRCGAMLRSVWSKGNSAAGLHSAAGLPRRPPFCRRIRQRPHHQSRGHAPSRRLPHCHALARTLVQAVRAVHRRIVHPESVVPHSLCVRARKRQRVCQPPSQVHSPASQRPAPRAGVTRRETMGRMHAAARRAYVCVLRVCSRISTAALPGA
jgi:hypothetical protein